MSLPFGDPCPRCGAASSATDARDRDCGCAACEVCGVPTGISCAVCGRSLGCQAHRIDIDEHVATWCLATPERHAQLGALSWLELKLAREELRASTPKPWPRPP